MDEPSIKRPVVIIGAPRSGTSLLFRTLSTSRHLWSLYRESHDIWNKFYRMAGKELKDDLLTESDLDEASRSFILNEFHKYTLNNFYLGYVAREYFLKKDALKGALDLLGKTNLLYKNIFLKKYRIVEKTPKNCFRIPFINKLFSDCKFIYLKRDGRSNINSLIEGWKSPARYVSGQAPNIPLNIKGYSTEESGKYWKFALPPSWQDYINKPLEEVCAFQWVSSNRFALDGLKSIEDERKYTINYEELTEDTYSTVKKLCDYIEIPFSKNLRQISKNLPLVNYVTKPHKNKWKKNIDLIQNTYPMIEPMMKELGYSFDD
ncbi:MAG: sulfotransferase [Candidatus Melainabacteria bacterium]|nr:sulfotransferase [Candidatus Melainabacteria bacterium]